jgi:4-hydroxybenzoate polyprenyltransferase
MLKSLARLARPKQWLKNGVVLASVVFGGVAGDPAKLLDAFLAMAVFCLVSSAVYAFNDLLDREQDRQHPHTRKRPLASGEVSPKQAIIMIVLLLLGGAVGPLVLGMKFGLVMAGYLILNVLYSLFLKHIVIVDVMSIALGFVLRAYAGAVAVGVPVSKWLLITTLLLALFLAFGKRRHELVLLEEDAASHRAILGRYSPYLLDQCIGVTTASVVVMYMLYTFSPEVATKLGTENLFLTIPFAVYGIFRYLYLIHKEDKGGDPTMVLIGDRPILITVILWLLTVIAVLYFG